MEIISSVRSVLGVMCRYGLEERGCHESTTILTEPFQTSLCISDSSNLPHIQDSRIRYCCSTKSISFDHTHQPLESFDLQDGRCQSCPQPHRRCKHTSTTSNASFQDSKLTTMAPAETRRIRRHIPLPLLRIRGHASRQQRPWRRRQS